MTSGADSMSASRFTTLMTTVLLVALPPLVYYVWICLEHAGGALVWPTLAMLELIPMPTSPAAGILFGWLAFQGFLQLYAPGTWVEGTTLADGTRLMYRMNGWSSWWITWAVVGVGVAAGLIRPTVLAEELGPLLTTTTLFTYAIAVYLYWHGKRHAAGHERITHNPVCDFWLGTARNPRIGGFDLKLFCEGRPGLIGWVAIDLSLAARQYAIHGAVSGPMILVCVFHAWYVADYFFHEEAILTTWDIKHENFGWMLCWGSLVWVPFMYTIQAYYLVTHPFELPWWAVTGIVLLHVAGYVIFRGTNWQKHTFRKDPWKPVWGKPARYITTAEGSLLLTSGWWGLARHMNYFGDLVMGLAWCLPTGFHTPLTYFYVVYFTILLVHRERRDHARCAARYGTHWETYCEEVRYRIVPGLY